MIDAEVQYKFAFFKSTFEVNSNPKINEFPAAQKAAQKADL